MMALLAILARNKEHQGIVMGLFSTTSYLGIAVLPFIAGSFADFTGFFGAFCITEFSAISVAVTTGLTPAIDRAQ